MNSSRWHVPVFAGQGSPLSTISSYVDFSIHNSSNQSLVLLKICHEAFIEEISSLSALEVTQTGISLTDFRSPESLLSMWPSRYPHNPVMSSSGLVLLHLIRYLSFVESFGVENNTLTPFSDLLSSYSSSGVLGFSSGILPACVVAASHTTASFLSFGLEAYRLALWIGVRCQQYQNSYNVDSSLPWSMVFLGVSPEAAQEAISDFQSQGSNDEDPSQLYLTAVMGGTLVTISGHPSALAQFSSEVVNESIVAHPTAVDTLYHSPLHLNCTRATVLSDIERRRIRFPDLLDLRAPIRSTLDGTLIGQLNNLGGCLVEQVLDMILVHPVRWDLVVDRVRPSFSSHDEVLLLNIGPGAALSRNLEKALPRAHIRDLSAESHQHPKQLPIAIVGMAVNMPGSPNVSELWNTLANGISTLSEIPEHRFNIEDYGENPKHPKRRMNARKGNFIQAPDEFDNRFFKISPREARCMDPQQRILLHTAYEALEDSGFVPGATPTSNPERFGCYIGVATDDYVQNLRGNVDVYYSPGTLRSFLSGRISYAMGFSGPSVVIDTACSSSLVAIHQAARALMTKDCDSALVGGVNVITSPDMFLGLDRGHFLHPSGPCRPFDAAADGYSRGEGCGMFVLKRLSDAITEGDHVYAVIRGIEVNQSGLAKSITYPHSPTQVALFDSVLRHAAIDPLSVNVVEAHGTGTQAGDLNELASIRQVFGRGRTSQNPLYVSSLKGNIGHLEAASGTASLAKVLLMFKHRTIPSQVSFNQLNPRIPPLEGDNTVISRTSVPWKLPPNSSRRIALINNFGAAGSNAALVVEEYAHSVEESAYPLLFTVSAKDEPALDKLRSKYIEWLGNEDNFDVPLADISYSMTARRQVYSYRLAVVASDRAQVVDELRKAIMAGPFASSLSPKVVFVFSGQGGQFLGMGRILYETSPLFRECIDECQAILIAMGCPGVVSIIKGDSATSLTRSQEIESFQSAIFALEYALAKVWMSWGIEPCAVLGHSLGEYAALVVAGVLDLRGALYLVSKRAQLMLRKCKLDSTGMLAINLSSNVVGDLLRVSPAFTPLVISCYNSPNDCVVSGPLATLEGFKNYLDTSMGCRSKMLAVPYGYHSSAMLSIIDELAAVASGVELRAPRIPVASNVYGRVVSPGDRTVFDLGYFSRHCSEPVRFDDGVRAVAKGCGLSMNDVWLEVGPHPTCLPMLKSNDSLLPNTLVLPSLKRNQDPWMGLNLSLRSLFLSDVPIKWRNLFAHIPSARCTALPSYPFAPSTYWIPYEENLLRISRAPRTSIVSEYTLLHRWEQYPCSENGFTALFETPISRLSDLILGHTVGDLPLCPASVFLEMVLAAVELFTGYRDMSAHENVVQIDSTEFLKGLVYRENIPRTVVTKITLDDRSGSFSVSSRVDPSTELVLHVRGEFRLHSISPCGTKLSEKLPLVTARVDYLKDAVNKAEIFLSRTTYDIVFPRVVQYAEQFHAIQSMSVHPNQLESFASIRLPMDCHKGSYIAHPVFLDALLQVPGFVANMQGSVGEAFICSEILSTEVVVTLLDVNAAYSVYCSGVWCEAQTSLSFEVAAIKEGDTPQIVAQLKGITFRKMSLDTLRRGLAIAAVSGCSQPPRRSPPAPIITTPFQSRARSHSSPPNFVNVVGEFQTRIFTTIAETCDIDKALIKPDTELDALGIDSLMLIELSARLQSLFPRVDLKLRSLYACTTVSDIVRISSSLLGLGDSPALVSPTTTCVESDLSSPSTLVADDKPSELSPSFSDISMKEIISNVLDVPLEVVADDIDLNLLGFDSLASMEVLNALRICSGVQLPNNFFQERRTVAAVHKYFAQQLELQSSKTDLLQSPPKEAPHARLIRSLRLGTNPVLVQSGQRDNTPIFFIHDGSGLINYYDRIGSLGRPVWAIYNPNFVSARPWSSIKMMAAAYADYIYSLSEGPVLLGGWSFGGVVAYEVAVQLAKRGKQTKGILLVDSPDPISHEALPDSLIKAIAKYDRRAGPAELGKLVQSQFSMNTQLLSAYDPRASGGACPPLVFLRSESGYSAKGAVDIPLWLADRSNPDVTIAGWRDLTSFPIQVWDIPGNHFQAFDNANIDYVSSKLFEACEYLDSLNL